MIMDLLVLACLILSAYFGYKKGFVLTAISFLQWFVCLIVAVVLCATVRDLIYDYTEVDTFIYDGIYSRISSSLTSSPSYASIPDIFGDWVDSGANAVADTLSTEITKVILTVCAFLLIILSIKLICYIVSHSLSKKYHHGILGFIDGVGGLFIGIIRGVFYIFIAFAILIPALGFLWPDLSTAILNSLDNSSFAGDLYQNNMLLDMVLKFTK